MPVSSNQFVTVVQLAAKKNEKPDQCLSGLFSSYFDWTDRKKLDCPVKNRTPGNPKNYCLALNCLGCRRQSVP